jgi:PleD family two-component response regulator
MFTSNIRHAMNKLIRIFIREDSATDAVLMEDELQVAAIPFISKRVFKEEDFVRELQDISPDLILSDYDLPQYNGALALAQAKTQYSHIPFILVTGVNDICLVKEIIIKGADDFVMKSQLHKLASAVRKVMKIEAR